MFSCKYYKLTLRSILHHEDGLAHRSFFPVFQDGKQNMWQIQGLMTINSSPRLVKLLITCTTTHMQLPGKQSVQETQSAQDRDNACHNLQTQSSQVG